MGEHTGGMVALIPADPSPLVVDGGEPAEELHVTLAYLGDDVTGWPDEQRSDILTAAQAMAAEQPGPIEARAFAHATFNPDRHADREPCAVYLIGDSGAPLELHQRFAPLASADQHPGYVAHLTAGYGTHRSRPPAVAAGAAQVAARGRRAARGGHRRPAQHHRACPRPGDRVEAHR